MNKTAYISFQNGKFMCTNGGLRLPVLPPIDNTKQKCVEKDDEATINQLTLSDVLPEEMYFYDENYGLVICPP